MPREFERLIEQPLRNAHFVFGQGSHLAKVLGTDSQGYSAVAVDVGLARGETLQLLVILLGFFKVGVGPLTGGATILSSLTEGIWPRSTPARFAFVESRIG